MTRRAAAPPLPPGTTAWYGKVPARGDFVSHAFAPAHIEAWDGWLLRGLRLASQHLSHDIYVQRLGHFAPWRFLAWPEGAAGAAWAGVLVASHDRVGRLFPLTVVQVAERRTLEGLPWLAIETALARLADAALDAVDSRDAPESAVPAVVESFESILRGLEPVLTAVSAVPVSAAPVAADRLGRAAPAGGAGGSPSGGTGGGAGASLNGGASGGAGAGAAGGGARAQQSPMDLLRNSPGTRSLWWSEPAPGAAPLPLGDSWPPHAELMLDVLGAHDEPA